MKSTNEELYRERENRVRDAIHLEKPDRIPVMLELSYFPAKYTGIPFSSAYYDYDRWLDAYCKTLDDFEPDIVQIAPFMPGKVYEILDSKQLKIPGHDINPYHTHQFIEGEFLKADEYDDLMEEYTDFLLRRYLPRIFGALEPLDRLPSFLNTATSYREVSVLAESIAMPEIQAVLEKLLEAGREMVKWRPKMTAFGKIIEERGFPLYGAGGEHIPYDHLSYHVRGLQGINLDMYRRPEKLIEVFDWMLGLHIKKAIEKARISNRTRIFFALHRGADIFMSREQFEKFYWPYAKKLVNALVDEGFTPCIFLEGDYTSRLKYFLELPKGKVLCRFDSSDIFKAKEVLKGHICIMGDVPLSLLELATTDEVKEYCKKLIDLIGKDGGFIMAPAGPVDNVKPENLKAMVEYTKEYGVYD